jgi:hypothetical protein
MKLMILSVLFLVVSCGKQVNTTKYIEIESNKEVKVPFFEGYYALPDGGFADVFEDAQKLVSSRNLRLMVRNSDDSTGIIPLSSIPAIALVNNTVYYRVNLSYTSAQNIKRDLTNFPVVGTFLTEIQVTKKDEKLFFTVIISDVNSLLYKKTIESI